MDLFDLQRFAIERNALDDLLDAVLKVSSLQGGRAAPRRHLLGVQLYTRLTVAGVTLLRLLPGNRLIEERWTPWWDWPSLAAVARNIIEAYLGFHYIAVERVIPEEDQFRRKIFWFHDNSEKYRLYRDWGAPAETLREFEEKLPDEKAAIMAHPVYGRLKRDQQKRAVSGQHAIYLSRNELLSRLPFSAAEIPSLYRLLSANVHAAPFSFHRQDNSRGRAMENKADRGYMCMTAHFTRKYLAAAVVELCLLMPELRGDAIAAYDKAKAHFAEVDGNEYPEDA